MKKHFNKKEIADTLTKWWKADNTCSDECIQKSHIECDLCVDCFQKLCKRFGCEWNKDNGGDKVFVR